MILYLVGIIDVTALVDLLDLVGLIDISVLADMYDPIDLTGIIVFMMTLVCGLWLFNNTCKLCTLIDDKCIFRLP